MTPKRITRHVTYDSKKEGWKVTKAGAKSPESIHKTQKLAIDKAVREAKKEQLGQIKIHKKQDHKIREERTYGDDPPQYPS